MNQKQTFATHRRYYPLQHFLVGPISLLTFVAALVYMTHFILQGNFSFSSLLLLAVAFQSLLLNIIARRSSLVAQDRAIRAEEQLRYFILTGQALDERLTIQQIIALRFASDREFPSLAKKAANTNMTSTEIKAAITSWKPDNHRV